MRMRLPLCCSQLQVLGHRSRPRLLHPSTATSKRAHNGEVGISYGSREVLRFDTEPRLILLVEVLEPEGPLEIVVACTVLPQHRHTCT